MRSHRQLWLTEKSPPHSLVTPMSSNRHLPPTPRKPCVFRALLWITLPWWVSVLTGCYLLEHTHVSGLLTCPSLVCVEFWHF